MSRSDENGGFFSSLRFPLRRISESYERICERMEAGNQRQAFELHERLLEAKAGLEQLEKKLAHSYTAPTTRNYSTRFFLKTFRRLRENLRTHTSQVPNTTPLSPPPSAELFLRYILPQKDRAALIGDLQEEYTTILRRYGATSATRWYWFQSLRTAFAYGGVALLKLLKFGLFAKVAGWVAQKLGG